MQRYFSNVTSHRCAAGIMKNLTYGRSPNAIDIVQGPTRGHPFIRLFRETAPLSRLLRHAGDTGDTLSI